MTTHQHQFATAYYDTPPSPAAYRPAFSAASAPVSTYEELKQTLREEIEQPVFDTARVAYLKAGIRLAQVMHTFSPEAQESVYQLISSIEAETDPRLLALKNANVDILVKLNALNAERLARVEKITQAMAQATEPSQFALLKAELDVLLHANSMSAIQIDKAEEIIGEMRAVVQRDAVRFSVHRLALDVMLVSNSLSREQFEQIRKTLQNMSRVTDPRTAALGHVAVKLVMNEDAMSPRDIGHAQGARLAMNYLAEPEEFDDALLRAEAFIFVASH